MIKKIFKIYDTENPMSVIQEMKDYTDNDEILSVAQFEFGFVDYEKQDYKMNWSSYSVENLQNEYKSILNDLNVIGENFQNLEYISASTEENSIIKGSAFNTFKKYVNHYKIDDFDLNTILYVYSCLNEDEFDDWKEITEEEQQHFDKYLECQKAEAKVNIGGELYTYEINVCCRRICKLIELNAPQIVVNQEKKLLAMFLTINKIAKAI